MKNKIFVMLGLLVVFIFGLSLSGMFNGFAVKSSSLYVSSVPYGATVKGTYSAEILRCNDDKCMDTFLINNKRVTPFTLKGIKAGKYKINYYIGTDLRGNRKADVSVGKLSTVSYNYNN